MNKRISTLKTAAIVIAIPVLIFVMLITVSLAHASGPPKHYFVCKYVSDPKGDERLKEGLNPINVPDPQNELKVGTGWTDAQEKSYVVAEDIGQATPKCPDNSDGTDDPDVPKPCEYNATIPATDPKCVKPVVEDPKPPVGCKIGRVVHYNDPETMQDPVCKDEVENTTDPYVPTPDGGMKDTTTGEVFYGK